ncbi:MAG: hypothetical protein M1817_004402 [Caeruleum heppii]|nr:MAG: hypothetical protein M1817_004402 [Caeruleum heppii]
MTTAQRLQASIDRVRSANDPATQDDTPSEANPQVQNLSQPRAAQHPSPPAVGYLLGHEMPYFGQELSEPSQILVPLWESPGYIERSDRAARRRDRQAAQELLMQENLAPTTASIDRRRGPGGRYGDNRYRQITDENAPGL